MARKKDGRQKKEISSETAALLEVLKSLILLPKNIFLYLVGKGNPKDISRPLDIITSFLMEAKFTITIITVNMLVFILSAFFPEEWINLLGVSPLNMLQGRLYTLLTGGFLHADIAHLASNMIFIFIFGRVVERKMGSAKTSFIYLGALVLSSIFSNIIYLVMGKNVLGIGASGALMGLVSAAMLINPFYITYVLFFPIPVMILGWMTLYSDIVGILTPLDTNIGHLAHLGGFLSITILIYFFSDKDKKKMKKGLMINMVSLVSAFILLMIFRHYIA